MKNFIHYCLFFTVSFIVGITTYRAYNYFFAPNNDAIHSISDNKFPGVSSQKTSDNAAKAGFQSLSSCLSSQPLSIQGTLPTWFKGTFLATGPALFELGDATVRYWFDGFAMLHRFEIQNNIITYSNAMLESGYYAKCLKQGTLPKSACATEKKSSWFSKISQALAPQELYDNGNAALYKLGDHYVAATETPTPVAFDPCTLTTIKTIEYDDDIVGHLATCPVYDSSTNNLFTCITEFGNTSYYHIVMIDETGTRTKLCSLPTKNPSYMRSIGITQHYVLLAESALRVNPLDLLFSTRSFIENFVWSPSLGTTITIIDKKTGALITTLATDAFFAFNHINAYEEHNTIVFDSITYPDHNVINALTLTSLRNNYPLPSSTITRLMINMDKKSVESTSLFNTVFEFPTINPNYHGKKYHYVYGLHAHNSGFFDQVQKVDLATLQTTAWFENNCYPSKPILVAKPQVQQEDDGIILSVVFDAEKNRSFLLILDAQTMQECARAYVPHHIPHGCNGIFTLN